MYRYPVLIWIASGVLFGLSFIFSFLAWCYIPAFILLLYGIRHEKSHKKIFIYGTIVGSLHYAGSFFWVWSTFPILWLADQSYALQLSAIGYYWVVTSVAVGIGGGLFALAVKRIPARTLWFVSLVPVLWVVSELMRSVIFSIYALGDGGFISAGFSYGYLGYLLAEHPFLVQMSVIGGVYVLSYLAALMGTVGFVYVTRVSAKRACVGLVCVVSVLTVLYFVPFTVHTPTSLGKEVISLEAYFDRTFLENDETGELKNAEVKAAVALALSHDPDTIVLPEDVHLRSAFASNEDVFVWVESIVHNDDVVIVDNGPAVNENGDSVIRSYMYDLKTREVYLFDKKHLVPQGEFLSYIHEGMLSLLITNEHLDRIKNVARFVKGTKSDSASYPHHLPGILFCFETMVPYGVTQAKSYRNPEFIAHPISHAWFTNPFSLEYQLDAMLKVHAVWNNIPVVTSGSMTESKLYLPTGEVEDGEIIGQAQRWVLKKFEF